MGPQSEAEAGFFDNRVPPLQQHMVDAGQGQGVSQAEADGPPPDDDGSKRAL